jgi:hypothetical protein
MFVHTLLLSREFLSTMSFAYANASDKKYLHYEHTMIAIASAVEYAVFSKLWHKCNPFSAEWYFVLLLHYKNQRRDCLETALACGRITTSKIRRKSVIAMHGKRLIRYTFRIYSGGKRGRSSTRQLCIFLFLLQKN